MSLFTVKVNFQRGLTLRYGPHLARSKRNDWLRVGMVYCSALLGVAHAVGLRFEQKEPCHALQRFVVVFV